MVLRNTSQCDNVSCIATSLDRAMDIRAYFSPTGPSPKAVTGNDNPIDRDCGDSMIISSDHA